MQTTYLLNTLRIRILFFVSLPKVIPKKQHDPLNKLPYSEEVTEQKICKTRFSHEEKEGSGRTLWHVGIFALLHFLLCLDFLWLGLWRFLPGSIMEKPQFLIRSSIVKVLYGTDLSKVKQIKPTYLLVSSLSLQAFQQLEPLQFQEINSHFLVNQAQLHKHVTRELLNLSAHQRENTTSGAFFYPGPTPIEDELDWV